MYWDIPKDMTLNRMDGSIAKPQDSIGFLMYKSELKNGVFDR